ncbi:dynactin subunit 3-like [Carassius gibelio]|uniref:dynactin subunit 3-like n=1 Tax=Carassius gibelio TaxID=101364 RepID=UPI0022782319|nr:dynactin subunit 3-like [Carassius gibelio]
MVHQLRNTKACGVYEAVDPLSLSTEEECLRSQATLLEQVHNLQPHQRSDPDYCSLPELTKKVQRLSQVHIKQQDQNEDLSAEVKTLFEDYNRLRLDYCAEIFLLSKQFSQWDEALRELEGPKRGQQMDTDANA